MFAGPTVLRAHSQASHLCWGCCAWHWAGPVPVLNTNMLAGPTLLCAYSRPSHLCRHCCARHRAGAVLVSAHNMLAGPTVLRAHSRPSHLCWRCCTWHWAGPVPVASHPSATWLEARHWLWVWAHAAVGEAGGARLQLGALHAGVLVGRLAGLQLARKEKESSANAGAGLTDTK